MLTIDHLSAAVDGKPILRDLSLTVGDGEVHVLLGPNGSGKSTLMNVIMGHPRYAVTGGSLAFNGVDLLPLPTFERAKLGLFLSFQSPEEIPGITVENMLRTARQSVTGRKAKILAFRKELRAAMDTLKIAPDYAERYLNVGFSGGEKKRMEILQLLMLNPKLALLDETDSGLDVDAVQIVSQGIRAYHNSGNAVLVITHNAQILRDLAVDRVHVLLGGAIVREGGPELIGEIERDGFGAVLP